MKSILKKIRGVIWVNYMMRVIVKSLLNLGIKINTIHLTVSGIVKITLPKNEEVKLFSKGDDYIPSKVYWNGYDAYEYSLIPFYFLSKKSNTIVDIGANIGYYSLVAAAANKRSSIYAFEPVPRIVKRFKIQLKINNFRNIIIEEKIIGDENKDVTFYIPEGNAMSLAASTKKGWASVVDAVMVKSITLDKYKELNNLSKVNLIKIDCEFHELEVLKGMSNILENDKPNILMEVLFPESEGVKGHFENDQYIEIEKIMKENNYNFYLITKEGLVLVDKLRYNEIDRNYLFSVKESSKNKILFSEITKELI